jgi:hypothetical protein
VTTTSEPLRPANVPDDLHQRVLAPYLPHARYVHRAALVQQGNGSSPRLAQPSSWLRVEGECGFEEPCYIAATGHLNAVECNITYNQLLYLGLAAIVRARLLPELRHWSLDDFFRAQLPDVLIGDYHARFRKPMGSRRYHGALAFTDVRPRPERQLLLLQTHADFHDPAGGECAVDATIALVHWQPA